MPEATVIIPVYNTEEYLHEYLDSVLSQSFTDLEVICVNDGSTDASPAILREYAAKDPRIIVIESENRGAGPARDLAMQRMRGKWVAFLDSDDILTEDTLEHQVKAAEENQVDILYHAAQSFFENETLTENFKQFQKRYQIHGSYPGVLSGPEFLQRIYDGKDYSGSVCVRLFRAAFLKEHDFRFKYNVSNCEDDYFSMLTALAADRVIVLNEIGFLRRIREGSNTTGTAILSNLRSRFIISAAMRAALAEVPPERLVPAAVKITRRFEEESFRFAAKLRKQGIEPETPFDRYMFDSIDAHDPLLILEASHSYRLGRALTLPLRRFKELKEKKK